MGYQNSREWDSAACIIRMLSMEVQRLASFAAESSFQHATTITALKAVAATYATAS